MPARWSRPKLSEKGLLTPDNCVVALIDHQPQMLFGVSNFNRQTIINNTCNAGFEHPLAPGPTYYLQFLAAYYDVGPYLRETQPPGNHTTYFSITARRKF